MRQFLLRTALVLLASVALLRAQSPVVTSVPWNGYDSVEVFQGNFTSIIGTGGTQLAGSESVGPEGKVIGFMFPMFPIGFLAQVTSPTTMLISTQGWISFNGSSSDVSSGVPEFRYTRSVDMAHYNKVLMAYWGDLQTLGVPNGGIYWKVDSAMITEGAGSVMRKYLTIEWCVRRSDDPGSTPGRFQARIYALGGGGINSRIELLYGGQSIDMPVPSSSEIHYGAQVGIKNFGQVSGDPAFNGDALDREKFLIACNPQQLPLYAKGGITRLRTMTVPAGSAIPTPYTPEWWASYARYGSVPGEYASPYYHYSFPPIGGGGKRVAYRMKPVTVDMGAMGIIINGLDPSVPNMIPANDLVQPTVVYKNLGMSPAFQIPVDMTIYRVTVGGLVALPGYLHEDQIPVLYPADSIIISMFTAAKREFRNPGPGYYRIVARVQQPGDQDPRNDTVTADFMVASGNDIMARKVVQPLPFDSPPYMAYRVGDAVPMAATFLNAGDSTRKSVRVGYEVRDENLKLIDSGSLVIASIQPAESSPFAFNSSWTPTKPGCYFFRAFVMTPDNVPFNDSVPKWPGVRFCVFDDVDLAVGAQDGSYPHEPIQRDTCYRIGALPVMVTVMNNGIANAKPLTVRVVIRNGSGEQKYSEIGTGALVPGGGGSAVLRLPPFVPTEGGTFCATAVVTAPGDARHENDTTRWCFCVLPASGVEAERGEHNALALQPNPAGTRTSIAYDAPVGERLRVVVVDALGIQVDELHAISTGHGSITLDVSRYPAGAYMVRLGSGRGALGTAKLTVVR